MPAKGKYLLNDQEVKREALYRKFSCFSQYQLLVLLLGLTMLSCAVLLILFFSLSLVSRQPAPGLHTTAAAVMAAGEKQVLTCGMDDGETGVLIIEPPGGQGWVSFRPMVDGGGGREGRGLWLLKGSGEFYRSV